MFDPKRFNHERHMAFYEKHGWQHEETCLCKNAEIVKEKELKLNFGKTQSSDYPPDWDDPKGEFKNIGEG